jgi:hypothetical protein
LNLRTRGPAAQPTPSYTGSPINRCADPLARYDVLAKIVGGDDASCLAVTGTVNWFAVSEVDPALRTQHPAYVLCLGPN